MRKLYVKHDNLRRSLEEIHDNLDDLDDFAVDRFISELKHSNLIIAADLDSTSLKFRLVRFEGKAYGLLFTDMAEFRKCLSDDESGSHTYDFNVYKTIIQEGALDGYVINPASEGFFLKRDLVLAITDLPHHRYASDDAYTSSQLKTLKDSIDNEALEDFIRNPSNIGDYDGLFEMISDSTLLTLMLSDEDLSCFANDGVISMMETGPIGFLYLDEIGGQYATVYTSESKIANVATGYNKYSQLVNFSQLANFILNDDMDGIIINPNSDNVLLTREVLLEYSNLLERTCNDSRLNGAIFSLFLIEEEA